eukprot:g17400.t1
MYIASGQPFYSDGDRWSRSGHGGQDRLVHYAPSYAPGAKAAQPTAASVRIQDTRQVPGGMQSHSSTQQLFRSADSAEAFSAPWPGQHQRGGGDQERGFQDYSPTSSNAFDGNKPATLCGDYAQDKPGLQHEEPGKKRESEGILGPEYDGIGRPGAEEKKTAGAARCEYPGCCRTSLYGTEEGILSFRHDHKRKGMYPVSKGMLMLATTGGSAFREAGSGPAANGDNAAEFAQVPHDSAQPLKAPAPAPSRSHGQDANARLRKNLEVASRKKCEISGCNIQPSYGTAGTTRPRFCSRHKEKSHVCLKNRPCLFPGCHTRPHYGLPGVRGVFFVAHKKEGMIHLLNETNYAKKEEATRQRREAHAAEEKDRSEGNPSQEESEEVSWEKRQEKRQNIKFTARRGESPSAGNAAIAGKRGSIANKRCKIKPGTFSQTTGSLLSQLTADGWESGPSEEMRLLLEGRESTRAAREAGNSGRRARLPSRKFLEASGRVVDEGVQWMTKEKREEQAKKKRELKDQKKAAAAAGLQVGQVLEIAALRLPRGANRGGGAFGSGGRAVSKVFWRKLTPAEILRIAGKQPAVDGAGLKKGKAADATGGVAVSTSKQEGETAIPAAAASETDTMPEKKHKPVPEASCPTTQQGSRVVETAQESKPKSSREDPDEGPREGENRASKAACEFENCPKKASFGVSGVVRYCQMHRIFGMHKIEDRTYRMSHVEGAERRLG